MQRMLRKQHPLLRPPPPLPFSVILQTIASSRRIKTYIWWWINISARLHLPEPLGRKTALFSDKLTFTPLNRGRQFYEERFAESILDSRREKIPPRWKIYYWRRACWYSSGFFIPRRIIKLLIKSGQRLHLLGHGCVWLLSRFAFSRKPISRDDAAEENNLDFCVFTWNSYIFTAHPYIRRSPRWWRRNINDPYIRDGINPTRTAADRFFNESLIREYIQRQSRLNCTKAAEIQSAVMDIHVRPINHCL